ncbi:ORF68 [White spot syndrome virus]|uniref:ORF68 n=1 Tax=White spot syndrome virus TaxID=342409 RepID=Q91LH2_9VIRU|nr:ORF68 [White spot syndrome virus]ALZ45726.1 hypothetical protein [White spot syndrome virus]
MCTARYLERKFPSYDITNFFSYPDIWRGNSPVMISLIFFLTQISGEEIPQL